MAMQPDWSEVCELERHGLLLKCENERLPKMHSGSSVTCAAFPANWYNSCQCILAALPHSESLLSSGVRLGSGLLWLSASVVHMRAMCRPLQEGVSCGPIVGSGQPFDRAPSMKEGVQGDKVLESMGVLRSSAMQQRSA